MRTQTHTYTHTRKSKTSIVVPDDLLFIYYVARKEIAARRCSVDNSRVPDDYYCCLLVEALPELAAEHEEQRGDDPHRGQGANNGEGVRAVR